MVFSIRIGMEGKELIGLEIEIKWYIKEGSFW